MTVVPTGSIWPSDEFNNVVLEAFGINKKIQAIGVLVSGAPQLSEAETDCWILIKELVATMPKWREQLVEASSSYTGTAKTIYAPNTLAKVETASIGSPRARIVAGLNEGNEHRALAAARYFAYEGIKRLQIRTYTTSNLPATLPDRCETVTMGDGYTGVVLSRFYEIQEGAERLELRLLNFDYGID